MITPEWVDASSDDGHAQDQADRSRSLGIGLLESGFHSLASLPADVFLAERQAQLQPDMIIVDTESEARDALKHVVIATREARRPIIMFTNDHDTAGCDGFAVLRLQTLPRRVCTNRGKPILYEKLVDEAVDSAVAAIKYVANKTKIREPLAYKDAVNIRHLSVWESASPANAETAAPLRSTAVPPASMNRPQ